jgi:cellulose synthase/poly-beta-1,6-N-acetylglucosamine synthase-like glycosyltransferase
LNYALATARGAFVTVFDAEDRPHPDQLLHALGAFAAGGDRLGALQAPILIDNSGANWLTRQFAEYALQFLGAVPLLTRLGLTPPLGGTSNHFRREALDDVVAWDPFNVTEDADLGFRLACRGWAIGAIAAPTYEGAPVHLRQWINQRSRWIKGYLQTWIVLMRRPKRALHELGLPSFVAAQLILLGGSFSALAHAPFTLWLAWSALHGEAPAAYWILCMAGVAAGFLTSLQAAAAARDLGLGWAALTAPLYWLLGFPAAAKALFELVARPHYWDKTAHGTPPSA